eukprot:759164-Hanusia_phi.AAC.2
MDVPKRFPALHPLPRTFCFLLLLRLPDAIFHYKQALDSMGGKHAATQYYLGTCQLDSGTEQNSASLYLHLKNSVSILRRFFSQSDAGKFEEGVRNVAAALKAEPDTFGPEAFQRLTAGQIANSQRLEKRI